MFIHDGLCIFVSRKPAEKLLYSSNIYWENFQRYLKKTKNVEGKSAVKSSFHAVPMSKTEQFLNLPLIESFRRAQEEEQTPPFSGVQNANASGS